MTLFAAALTGLIFGIGLILAGMTNPAKVLAFLDLAGAWDPSLAFVMAGAIAVGVVAFTIARRRGKTLLGTPLHLPTSTTIDKRLVVGGFVFGAGWGLAGFCPGPAVVSAASLEPKAMLFIIAMLVGMGIHSFFESRGR